MEGHVIVCRVQEDKFISRIVLESRLKNHGLAVWILRFVANPKQAVDLSRSLDWTLKQKELIFIKQTKSKIGPLRSGRSCFSDEFHFEVIEKKVHCAFRRLVNGFPRTASYRRSNIHQKLWCNLCFLTMSPK